MTQIIKTADQITREEFSRYVIVQNIGDFNMHSQAARDVCSFSRETHLGIITNYRELLERYPDVAELVK